MKDTLKDNHIRLVEVVEVGGDRGTAAEGETGVDTERSSPPIGEVEVEAVHQVQVALIIEPLNSFTLSKYDRYMLVDTSSSNRQDYVSILTSLEKI